jgi:putative transposase
VLTPNDEPVGRALSRYFRRQRGAKGGRAEPIMLRVGHRFAAARGIITVPAWAARMETDKIGGMKPPPDPHYRHRFPAAIICYAVWLYHVFSLSLRDFELLLAERGIVVSYETVRRWSKKFGQTFASRLRHRQGTSGTSMRSSSESRACSTISGARGSG